MIGATVVELAVGDVLPQLDYEVSAHSAREYARGTEWSAEVFHAASVDTPGLAPPTLIHALKVRMLHAACPGGSGAEARMHYEYDVSHHSAIRVGQHLRVEGRVDDCYVRRGRRFMTLLLSVRDAATGALVATYRDTSLIGRDAPGEES